jgi:hypothetical protein
MIATLFHAYPLQSIQGSVPLQQAENVLAAVGGDQVAVDGGRAYQRVQTDGRCECQILIKKKLRIIVVR